MRHAYRKDRAQTPIAEGLKAVGASVENIDVGNGLPDLLVGFRGETYLLEVKTHQDKVNRKKPSLTPRQVKFMKRWQGKPALVVETLAEALQAIGLPYVGAHELESGE